MISINPAQKVPPVGGIIPPTATDYLTIRLRPAPKIFGTGLRQKHFLRGANKQNGFTLMETIAVLALFSIVVLLVGSMYVLAQQAYIKSADKAELTQNIRVCLDRISRELRQAAVLATDISTTPSDEIFFQDGHNIDEITYIRYYLNGTDLMRSHIAYYFDFPDDPAVYVIHDSAGSPETIILEDRIVGEYFNNMAFLGSGGLINISMELKKGEKKLNINSNVYIRNW
ncbi:MAG: prepilin-type N-terminal cleavage/methylation domain-containing protein [Candidatus Falkowbacteria bacterium]